MSTEQQRSRTGSGQPAHSRPRREALRPAHSKQPNTALTSTAPPLPVECTCIGEMVACKDLIKLQACGHADRGWADHSVAWHPPAQFSLEVVLQRAGSTGAGWQRCISMAAQATAGGGCRMHPAALTPQQMTRAVPSSTPHTCRIPTEMVENLIPAAGTTTAGALELASTTSSPEEVGMMALPLGQQGGGVEGAWASWRAPGPARPHKLASAGRPTPASSAADAASSVPARNSGAQSYQHSTVCSTLSSPQAQVDHWLAATCEYARPPATGVGTPVAGVPSPVPSCPCILFPTHQMLALVYRPQAKS